MDRAREKDKKTGRQRVREYSYAARDRDGELETERSADF